MDVRTSGSTPDSHEIQTVISQGLSDAHTYAHKIKPAEERKVHRLRMTCGKLTFDFLLSRIKSSALCLFSAEH